MDLNLIVKLLEIINTIVGLIIIFKCADIFFVQKYDEKISNRLWIINIIISLGVNVTEYSFSSFALIFFLALQILFVHLIYEGEIFKKGLLIIVFIVISVIMEMFLIILVMALFNQDIYSVLGNTYYRALLILLANTSMPVLIVGVMGKFYKKTPINMYENYFEILGIVLCAFSITMVLFMLFNQIGKDNFNINDYIVSICLICGINLGFILLLCFRTLAKCQENLRLNLKIGQLDSTQILYENIADIMDELVVIRHDMKHHVIAIGTYLENNETLNARQYIDNVWGKVLTENVAMVIDGYPILSALLTTKKKQADQWGAEFMVHITKDEKINISKQDLLSVMANILDNAVEAVSVNNDEKKYIECTIIIKNGSLLIRCINTYFHTIYLKNKKLCTSKEDKRMHGIGMSNIEDMARRYDGKLNYTYDGEIFSTEVFMRNIEVDG